MQTDTAVNKVVEVVDSGLDRGVYGTTYVFFGCRSVSEATVCRLTGMLHDTMRWTIEDAGIWFPIIDRQVPGFWEDLLRHKELLPLLVGMSDVLDGIIGEAFKRS